MDPDRRPVNRTPPDYQTIIKFLLMSSILDALWGGGEPSGCGLVTTPGPLIDQGELSVDALEAVPHSWEHQDEIRLGKATPLLIRVLSLLTFNVFVLSTDLGAVLVHQQHQKAVGGAPTWGRSPSRWMEGGSAIDIDTPGTNTSSCAVPGLAGLAGLAGVTSPAPPPVPSAPSPPRSPRRSPPRSPSRSPARSPARTTTSRDPYWEEAMAYSVPWHTQLLYIAMLMLLVVGVPRCPVVLENACTFLMC